MTTTCCRCGKSTRADEGDVEGTETLCYECKDRLALRRIVTTWFNEHAEGDRPHRVIHASWMNELVEQLVKWSAS